MNSTFTQLDSRRDRVLQAIQTGTIPPSSDTLGELAELSQVLEEKPVKPTVVARLTIVRKNGLHTLVEVRSDARFHSFYHFYRQLGAKRSTKQLIRTADRSEGTRWIGFHFELKPGLEIIAKRLEMYSSQSNPVISKRIRIIKKRAYRRLLTARPNELGLTHTSVHLPLNSYARLLSRGNPS